MGKTLSIHSNIYDESRLFGVKVNCYDGIQNNARVDNLGNRKLYTKVVDQVLTSPTVATRLFSGGQPFEGKTMDITMDVLSDGAQFQWVTGLESLNLAATQTTVTTSYAHAAGTQPQVSVMLESFANTGALGIISLDSFKYQKAAATVLQQVGSSAYSTGSGNQILGLEAIIDDSTNNATIGGISRSTYTSLKDGYQSAVSNGKLTLATMGTAHDGVRAAGLSSEKPNIGYTTKANFTLFEQLLSPNVRAAYEEVGYDRVPLKSKYGQRSNAVLRNGAGFDGLSYRTMYIIDDDFCPSGILYFVNEDYIHWYGRSEVPEEYKDYIDHVSFGSSSAYEGTGPMALAELPSNHHGWFYQKPQMMPAQAGKAARFWVIGQFIADSFRRQGKLTGITGI